jgi:hypothetical protein
MIAVSCSRCGEKYFAEQRHIGHCIRCVKCSEILVLNSSPSSSLRLSSIDRLANYVRPLSRTLAAIVNGVENRWAYLCLVGIVVSVFTMFIAALELRSEHGISLNEPLTLASGSRASTDSDDHGDKRRAKESIPEVPPRRDPVSLPIGTWILKPDGLNGENSLKIRNGTGLDAAVKLLTSTEPPRTNWMIYIRSGDTKVIKGIPRGLYLLRFALGTDWYPATRKFLLDREFYQANGDFDFTEGETESTSGVRSVGHTEIDVTLHLVPNGNLRRESIDEHTFAEGEAAE